MERGTKILLLVLLLIAGFLVYRQLFVRGTVSRINFEVVDGPWLEGWEFRVPLRLVAGSNILNETIVLGILDTKTFVEAGYMKPDCSDIRITDIDGVTLLPFWIQEDTCSSENTYIYVKLLFPESDRRDYYADDIIFYVYFGNKEAKSASDGEKLFEFFDDFSKDTIDTNKWIISSGSPGDKVYIRKGKLYIETDNVAPIKTVATARPISFVGAPYLIVTKNAFIETTIPNFVIGTGIVNELSPLARGVFVGYRSDWNYGEYGNVYLVENGNYNPAYDPVVGYAYNPGEGYVSIYSLLHLLFIFDERMLATYPGLPRAEVPGIFGHSAYIILPRAVWNEPLDVGGLYITDFIFVARKAAEVILGRAPRNYVEIHRKSFWINEISPKEGRYLTNKIPLEASVLAGSSGKLIIQINNTKVAEYDIESKTPIDIKIDSLERYIDKVGRYTVWFIFKSDALTREKNYTISYVIPGLYGVDYATRRIPIYLEEISGQDMYNVTIPINISELVDKSYIKVDMDCGNIYVTDFDGYTPIPYWIEKCVYPKEKAYIETKAYYRIGYGGLPLADYINFPSTTEELEDYSKDVWSCDNCDMYIRVYLKYINYEGARPNTVRIRIRSDDGHALWVNGRFIERMGGLYNQPGTAEAEYDITPFIRDGDNELWIWCSEGWGDEYCFFSIKIDDIVLTGNNKIYVREEPVLWVKIPKINARDRHVIYLYYGNRYIGGRGNPKEVFELYEDFETFDREQWSVFTKVSWDRMPIYYVRSDGQYLEVFVDDILRDQGAVFVEHNKPIIPSNKRVEFKARMRRPGTYGSWGSMSFIGLVDVPFRFQNVIGHYVGDWECPRICPLTGEKLVVSYDYMEGTLATCTTYYQNQLRVVNMIRPYNPEFVNIEDFYLFRLSIVNNPKLNEGVISEIYTLEGGRLSTARTERILEIYYRPMSLGIMAATWCDICPTGPVHIYIDWIRVYNYYKPEPIISFGNLEETPDMRPMPGKDYETALIELLYPAPQQPPTQDQEQPPSQEQQPTQPPQYQPPTYQPPAMQPTENITQPVTNVTQPVTQPAPGVQIVIDYIRRNLMLVAILLVVVILVLLMARRT